MPAKPGFLFHYMFFRQAETFAKFFSIPENTCVMLGLDPEYLFVSKEIPDTRVKPEYDEISINSGLKSFLQRSQAS